MATSPDARVIDRESNKEENTIMGRYGRREKAGGVFDAYAAGTNTMILGVQAPFGFTHKSRTYTIEPGFAVFGILSARGGENFNKKALNYADTLPGFNTKRYFR